MAKKEKTGNVALPRIMIKQMDFVIKHLQPHGFTSRPEFLKALIRKYLDKLVALGIVRQDELNRAS